MTIHKNFDPALDILKILNHPVRLSILINLIEHGEMPASDIFKNEQSLASQSQVSQYLKQLRDKGLVVSRKEGQFVFYKIISTEIQDLIKKVQDLYA